ncbi:hypothetical protein GCM10011410_25660 [Hoyosella rhizosphaerae]|uniref:Uncharacterized protein n=1 Tax=Hoyosella rhizosphaerae TaxID=1755582 RepID=A0A916XGD3_9ACTN|nr:hypothetical protein GCM10011410_25660 [Hoyosella rhizosphaerae]
MDSEEERRRGGEALTRLRTSCTIGDMHKARGVLPSNCIALPVAILADGPFSLCLSIRAEMPN